MVHVERLALRVLLVEDSESDADLTKERLSDSPQYDLRIRWVRTLKEAREALGSGKCDVVFLDLNLPDSRGIETLRALRSVRDDTPIVILSGIESEEAKNLACRLGALDYVGKNESQSRLFARAVLYALERHRAQERERQIEKLVSQNPDGVVVVDGGGAVQFLNEAAVELFGRSREEIIGEPIGFSVLEGHAAEIEILRGKERRFCEMRVVDIEWQGRSAHLATLRDTTEQRRLGEALRQSQRIEAVGRMAGGIAHDFNNLLTVILGYSEMLLMSSPLDPEKSGAILEIQRTSERAAALTRQLLAFSRKSVITPVRTDINGVITELQKMLTRLIGEDIQLSLALDPAIAPVLVDRSQFEQVVLNLVVNARDAMPTGGSLKIITRNVTVDASGTMRSSAIAPGNYAVVSVADDGCGIAPDVLGHIFEPFFTTKADGKGTGLGLATVYGIVTQNNGHVLVASEVGQGTTFDVFLPAIHAKLSADEPEPTPYSIPCGMETILLAEDDASVRDLAQLILESSGYRVITAVDGVSALQIANSHRGEIELLITDIVMPKMSGPRLAEQIRIRHPRIKVLFVSGYHDDAITRHGLDATTMNVLHKPFTATLLAQHVRQALESASTQHSASIEFGV